MKKLLPTLTAAFFALVLSTNAHAFKVGGMNWVANDGTSGQCLGTDGHSNLEWLNVLTLAGLSGTSPITFNNSTGAIGITSTAYIHPDGTQPFAGAQSLSSYSLTFSVGNASSGGTANGKIAKLTSSGAVTATTSDTNGVLGIVVSGGGTTGSAELALVGQPSCVFDNATTEGDYVQVSTSTAGDCHDAGGSAPTGVQVLGRAVSTNGSAGTYSVAVTGGGGGGGVALPISIANGGTGQTTQQLALNAILGAVTSGDYVRCDGTNCGVAAIQAGDVPTLNQNTTGNAATATNAVNASNVTVTGASANQSYYPVVVPSPQPSASPSPIALADLGGITLNPSTSTITATNFAGTASGNTTYTANSHGVVLSGTGNAMTVLAPASSTAFSLISGGSSANPAWGLLSVPGGGTGQVTFVSHGVVLGAGTSGLGETGTGTTGQPLVSAGSSTDPSYQTLGVLGGGTGAATLAIHGVLVGEGTSAVALVGPGTSGLPLVANGASLDPSFQSLGYSAGGTSATTQAGLQANASPMTTKGDTTIYSTLPARQAVPGDNGALVPDSTQTNGWRAATYTQWQNGAPITNFVQFGSLENNSTLGWGLGSMTGSLTNGLPTSANTPTFTASVSASTNCSATSGSSSANLSCSTTSSSPLGGVYSLQLVSSAATTVGNNIHTAAYAIDSGLQGGLLPFRFKYAITSGASNVNITGGSSNSFSVFAYDVTNSVFLGVINPYCIATVKSTCVGAVAIGSSTASVRLGVINSNATAGAATLEVDNVYLGEINTVTGFTGTDLVAYTPTITGFGSGGTAPTNVYAYSHRVGPTLEGWVGFTSGTSTATTASVTYGFNGGNANVSSQSIGTTNYSIGDVAFGLNSASSIVPIATIASSTSFQLGNQGASSNGLTAANGNGLLSSGNAITIHYVVPIVGWSSNMYLDSSTRVLPTYSVLTSGTSVVSPAGAVGAIVEVWGGGAGGGGGGNSITSGTVGNASTWDVSGNQNTAAGGSGGGSAGNGSAGGAGGVCAALNSGTAIESINGAPGAGGTTNGLSFNPSGGVGGGQGGGAPGAPGNNAGGSAAANSAGGGAGGSGSGAGAGGGGGEGCYLKFQIGPLASSYAYAIAGTATGGTAGTASTGGAGGGGAAGKIVITWIYANQGTTGYTNNQTVRSVTGAYTAQQGDDVINASASGGAFTVTLNLALYTLKPEKVCKTDTSANAVTVATSGSDTIYALGGTETSTKLGGVDCVTFTSDQSAHYSMDKSLRSETLSFGGSGSMTSRSNCTAGTCTTYATSFGGATSNYNSGTGNYYMAFPSGEFSATPSCTFSCDCQGVGDWPMVGGASNAASSTLYYFHTGYNYTTGCNATCDVTCTGPR